MVKTILVDRNADLVGAWEAAFETATAPSGWTFEIRQEDFLAENASALVSPANCFGYMDGGLDDTILVALPGIDDRVQAAILAEAHGELPVGQALVVETGDKRWPLLVAAPTMRIPEPVPQTYNAYYAFRAVLLAIKRWNADNSSKPIETVRVPGFASGIGQMSPKMVAAQMREAWDVATRPARRQRPSEVHEASARMKALSPESTTTGKTA